jgi:hypothetical protein
MKTLRIQFGSDATECLAVARSCLEADPLANNMVLSVLEAQADSRTATLRWAAVVDDTKTCVGVVAETWAQRPLLSSMTPEVAAFAMDRWLSHYGIPKTVFGPATSVAAAQSILSSTPEWADPLKKSLPIYELITLNMPSTSHEGMLVFPSADLEESSMAMRPRGPWAYGWSTAQRSPWPQRCAVQALPPRLGRSTRHPSIAAKVTPVPLWRNSANIFSTEEHRDVCSSPMQQTPPRTRSTSALVTSGAVSFFFWRRRGIETSKGSRRDSEGSATCCMETKNVAPK